MRTLTIAAAIAATLSPASAIPLGWHSAPEVLCGWFGANGTSVFYAELSTGDFLFSSDVLDVASLQAACAHGNVLGWHVVNATTGAFDQTVVFPK